MRISIPSLRVFATVAEMGSIVEAAEKLGRTPSSVSMTLKQFEEDVGGSLFETERKNRLSKVGAFVDAQVRDLLSHYDRTLASIQAFARNAIGRVDIACVPSVATTILPDVISQFRMRWPAVEIDIHDADSRTVTDAVEAGKVEVGIASIRRERAAIRFEPLFEEPLGIICRNDDPLSTAVDPLPWRSLEGRILLANGISDAIDDPDFQRILTGAPIVVYNVLSLIALVRSGVGVTVLPRLSIISSSADIAFIPIATPDAIRTVGLVTRATEKKSPAAAAFVDILKAALHKNGGEYGITQLFEMPEGLQA